MDKEQCGGWCRLALKSAVTGLGFSRRVGSGWLKSSIWGGGGFLQKLSGNFIRRSEHADLCKICSSFNRWTKGKPSLSSRWCIFLVRDHYRWWNLGLKVWTGNRIALSQWKSLSLCPKKAIQVKSNMKNILISPFLTSFGLCFANPPSQAKLSFSTIVILYVATSLCLSFKVCHMAGLQVLYSSWGERITWTWHNMKHNSFRHVNKPLRKNLNIRKEDSFTWGCIEQWTKFQCYCCYRIAQKSTQHCSIDFKEHCSVTTFKC